MKKNDCTLALGGHVNGYPIIQELHEKKIEEIILFGDSGEIASYSIK